MPGVTGADVKAAFAVSNTWGTPASVTAQVLLTTTEGLDGMPTLVDDDAFNQSFLGEGESGDYPALTPELGMQLRYEGAAPKFIAYAMGSAAAPSSVSSGPNSITAYSHLLTMAASLTKYLTLAIDETEYVLEVPSLKIRGYSLKVGENGRMMITFPAVGAKPSYASTVNTNSTVGGATAASLLNRAYRRQGVFRMNLQSAGSLAASDANAYVTDITMGAQTPLTTDDFVFGQDYIIEPTFSGFAEFPLDITFAQMNTTTANSLVIAAQTAKVFKADLTFTGAYINSTTPRSITFEWPALQIVDFKAPVTGHNAVKPVVSFRAKQASAAPTGMAFTTPRCTIVNTNSANLTT
jgi:hypothetical protein